MYLQSLSVIGERGDKMFKGTKIAIQEEELPRNFFPELDNLPTTDHSTYDVKVQGDDGVVETKSYRTHLFNNGQPFCEGESVLNWGCDTMDEAIDLTKECIQTLLKEYPVVAVRVKPTIRKAYHPVLLKYQFYMYMRLAF